MSFETLSQSLQEALRDRDIVAIRGTLEEIPPADLADYLDALSLDDAWALLRELSSDERAVVFGYLRPALQVDLAQRLNRRDLARLFQNMESDERADLFNRLEPDVQQMVLPGLAQAEREDIRRLSSYAAGTAGAIMTSDYATLRPGLSAQDALDMLRREAPDKETIYQAYVLDKQRRILGTVSLRDLILAHPYARIEDLMTEEVIHAHVEDSQEQAARLIARYDLLALPIINGGDKMVGIVTYDDAMDAAEEETTEDMLKGATVGKIAGSVKDATIATLYQKRVFWLVLLVFGNVFSGAGIAFFEDTIASYVALVVFLPLLIGSGGNAGAQASTLMVRALATGDVVMRDWAGMLGKEFAVALLLGITMAAAVSTLGVLYGGTQVALVVSLSMVVIVLVGSVIGMSLPFLLNRLQLDPASASAPLVTSIADVSGVLIYFAIATRVLGL